MQSLKWQSNIVNIIILAILAAVFYWLAPVENQQPVGLVLPVANSPLVTSASLPTSNVAMLNHYPAIYTKLAKVHLEMHYKGDPDFIDEQRIVTKARSMASQIGANAIVVTSYGHTIHQAEGLTLFQFQGMAIKTPLSPLTPGGVQ